MNIHVGIWNFDGKEIEGGLLARLRNFLKPDMAGEIRLLQKNSLAILYDASGTNAQPVAGLAQENRPWMFWDGRLDNRRDLEMPRLRRSRPRNGYGPSAENLRARGRARILTNYRRLGDLLRVRGETGFGSRTRFRRCADAVLSDREKLGHVVERTGSVTRRLEWSSRTVGRVFGGLVVVLP